MAEKNDVYGLEVDADASGVKAMSDALDDVDKSAEKAEDSVKHLGAQTDECGSKAASLGTTWGDVGKAIGSRFTRPFTSAFKTIGDKTKAFGTQFKQTTKNIGNFIKHPIDSIKTGLIGALEKTKVKTKDVEESAEKMGNELADAGKAGSDGMGKLTGMIKGVVAAIAAVGTAKAIGSFIKDSVGASETLASAESKLTNLLKENSAAANEWGDSYAKAANRSAGEVKGFMAQTAGAFAAYGVASDELDELGESATALSYDLAAVYKKDDAEVVSQMVDAIRGNKEALGEYGVALDDVTLNQTAAAMGFKGEIGALTEAQQVQVRYQAILNQTEKAQLGALQTQGDYTNGLKSIKGVYQNFMSTVGEKFSPILGSLFDKVLQMWPKVEPALMGLVDLLADGLSDAVPVIADLAEQIIPSLAETIGSVFTAVKPLIPIVLDLIKKLLPPVAKLIQSLVENLLPPLISVIEIVIPPLVEIIDQILPPLIGLIEAIMPPVMNIIESLLPPLIDFVQMLIPPILQIVDAVLPPLLDIINTIIPPILQIVEAILPPLLDIINTLLPPLLDIVNAVMPIIQKILEALMPIFTKLAETLMPAISSILSAISPILSAIAPVMEVIGTVLGVIIDAISWIIDKVLSVGKWVLSLFGIDAGAAEDVTGTEIPSNAGGTDSFEGGWTHINELGGEMAYLPKGSQIIPADKSQQVADSLEAASEKSNTDGGSSYQITVPITIQGNVDTTVMAEIEARIKAAVKQAIDEAQQTEYNNRVLQGAY